MSFILDALQKSENQRQRQLGPGLATVRRGKVRQAVPVWVPLLAILLGVNIVILVFVMWPGDESVQVAATPGRTDTRSVADDSVSRGIAATQKRGEVRSLSREALVATHEDSEPAVVERQTQNRSGAGSVAVMTEQEMNEFLGTDEAAVKVDANPAGSVIELLVDENTAVELLPAMQELQLRGLIALPDLHLDVHVYSETDDERFVFVNMKKYREGERLREGPLIESITPQGIILRHNGRRFILNQD
ncbi:MAG: general secretion pathway protein GspB [Proteobacteria bacterium]|nr:general secretion pathway protein GspB [Pseudomonadota bacterium]MCH8220482.1 general secretion pathway protein GspB [Pseudomonadota bacterium]